VLLTTRMATSAAAGLLGRQLKQMQSDKDIPGISCGLVDNNVLEWEVMLMISDDCRYYGGMRAHGLPIWETFANTI
jgi:ubiquitin-conjugating enzyme E2 G1